LISSAMKQMSQRASPFPGFISVAVLGTRHAVTLFEPTVGLDKIWVMYDCNDCINRG